MQKKIVIIICLVLVLIIIGVLASSSGSSQTLSSSNSLTSQLTQLGSTKPQPSNTFKEYTDPSGFTISYPDNLSLTTSELTDANTYADLLLSSKEVSGSLTLRITDSEFKTLEEWIKENKLTAFSPKEVQLGNIKALEVKLKDRLLLGALDQGIFFTVELPLIEEGFWNPVYQKVLSDFAFAAPEAATSQSSSAASSDVVFEGEELVE